jgi:hypothetical protein
MILRLTMVQKKLGQIAEVLRVDFFFQTVHFKHGDIPTAINLIAWRMSGVNRQARLVALEFDFAGKESQREFAHVQDFHQARWSDQLLG